MGVVSYNGKNYYTVDNKLTIIKEEFSSILDIQGLQNLTDLKKLHLSSNKITKIEGLENLTNLTELNLSNNEIEKIEGLNSLTNLKVLYLHGNQLSRIENLSALSNLEELHLEYTSIVEIKKLKLLKNLRKLYLNNNNIRIIKGLEKCKLLMTLNLSDNPIGELEGLGQLENLVKLQIKNTQISKRLIEDLGGINNNNGEVNDILNWKEYCKGKYVVYNDFIIIIKCDILDLGIELPKGIPGLRRISELQNFENQKELVTLNLSNHLIEEIEDLSDLENLKKLRLNNNKIREIRNIEKLTNLEVLSLHSNQIKEIKGLDKLHKLKYLDLSNNHIQEIKGLEALHNLKTLDLSGNKINGIRGLDNLIKLEKLYLSDNTITDIENLGNLTQLDQLDLSENKIIEIKGLENLSMLKNLNLYNNLIKNVKGLNRLINVVIINLHNNPLDSDIRTALGNDSKKCVSYCILSPILKNLKERIEIKNIGDVYPNIRTISPNELYKVCQCISYTEFQMIDGKIQYISNPLYLAQEIYNFMRKLDYDERRNYAFFKSHLGLMDQEAAIRLINFIFQNNIQDTKFNKVFILPYEDGIERKKKTSIRYIDFIVLRLIPFIVLINLVLNIFQFFLILSS